MLTPHRLHVSVTDRQIEALRNESDVTGAPIAEITRRAIDEYLTRRTEYKGRVHHADGNPRNNEPSNLVVKRKRGGK